jgi:hypothetical protein
MNDYASFYSILSINNKYNAFDRKLHCKANDQHLLKSEVGRPEKERNYRSGIIPLMKIPAITDFAKLMMSFI